MIKYVIGIKDDRKTGNSLYISKRDVENPILSPHTLVFDTAEERDKYYRKAVITANITPGIILDYLKTLQVVYLTENDERRKSIIKNEIRLFDKFLVDNFQFDDRNIYTLNSFTLEDDTTMSFSLAPGAIPTSFTLENIDFVLRSLLRIRELNRLHPSFVSAGIGLSDDAMRILNSENLVE